MVQWGAVLATDRHALCLSGQSVKRAKKHFDNNDKYFTIAGKEEVLEQRIIG